MKMRETAGVDHVERGVEHRFRLCRKADDEVGAIDDIGPPLAQRAADLNGALPRMAALHALQDQIVAGLQRQMQMRAKPRIFRKSLDEICVDFDAIDRRETQPFKFWKAAQQQTHEAPERPTFAKVDAVAREIDARQHDLLLAARDKRAGLRDDLIRRRRARRAAAEGNDAEGAAMIAAVLHGKQPARALNARKRAIWRMFGEDPRHPFNLGEAWRIEPRRAACDDDLGLWPLAMQPADRLTRLSRGLARDGAGVDDHRLTCAGVGFGELLRLDGVKPASEGDHLGAAKRRVHATTP